MRLIRVIEGDKTTAKIYWDSVTREYQVKFPSMGEDATYFTDCKYDAFLTATSKCSGKGDAQ